MTRNFYEDLERRMKDPEFAEGYQEAEAEIQNSLPHQNVVTLELSEYFFEMNGTFGAGIPSSEVSPPTKEAGRRRARRRAL